MYKALERMRQDVTPDEAKSSHKRWIQITLEDMLKEIKETLGHSKDIVIRELVVQSTRMALIYTDGLVNDMLIQDITESILHTKNNDEIESNVDLITYYSTHLLAIGEVHRVDDYRSLYEAVLSGNTVFLIDGYNKGLTLGTMGWESRAVEEPVTQTVIRGPRDSFTENLRTNTALIRRKVKSPKLWLETKTIGVRSKTLVSLMYIHDIVEQKLIDEIHERLNDINVDGLFDSGMIEELITDTPYTPFPTLFNTERPDTVANALLEGKVAIIVDGTPFVLIAPAVFMQFFHVSEDFYDNIYIANFTRVIRFICFFISLFLLSLYVSMGAFHHEMIPTPLLNNIAGQREGVPFPIVVEAFFLMGSFEILREAGVRMPRVVGSAISIVGGLVLGQSAVEAGIVSAAIVIVVALVALSDFVMPYAVMADAVKLMRYLLLLFTAVFGMYGLACGVLLLIFHLCSLRSFGVSYMAPMAPFKMKEQKDALFRAPKWAQSLRPLTITNRNRVRENMSAPKPNKSNETMDSS